jgi:hypothetical protein
MKKLILMISIVLLAGCTKPAIRSELSNNGQIVVDLLFEKDGVKVYRFQDCGRYIYYTDARGKTEWITSRSNGKTSHTERHTVETQ